MTRHIGSGGLAFLFLVLAVAARASDNCDVVAGAQATIKGAQATIKGAQATIKKCVACHSLDTSENGVGPSLQGVYGRKIAAYEGFRYSRALRKIEGEWTAEELDKFLLNPQTYAPGTRMAFGGLQKDQERADVICFLKQQGG